MRLAATAYTSTATCRDTRRRSCRTGTVESSLDTPTASVSALPGYTAGGVCGKKAVGPAPAILPKGRFSRTPTTFSVTGGPMTEPERSIEDRITDYLEIVERVAGLYVGQLDEEEMAALDRCVKTGEAKRSYEGLAGSLGLAKVRLTGRPHA